MDLKIVNARIMSADEIMKRGIMLVNMTFKCDDNNWRGQEFVMVNQIEAEQVQELQNLLEKTSVREMEQEVVKLLVTDETIWAVVVIVGNEAVSLLKDNSLPVNTYLEAVMAKLKSGESEGGEEGEETT